MKIIVDAMGGDNAPEEVIAGAIKAVRDFKIDIILVGKSEKIKSILGDFRHGIEIVDANQIITNDEAPVAAIRNKKDSSIVKGLNLLKEKKGHAMVSAGNTGALMAGGLFILGRFKGINRPAIAVMIPTKKEPTLLLDAGANSEIKSKNLVQFAILGNVYMKEVLKRENPRVGLLNIGTEAEKGTLAIKDAYSILEDKKDLNFVGNIEARDLFNGSTDIIVCDGFSGNVFIKTVEGFSKFLCDFLTTKLQSNCKYYAAAKTLSPVINDFKSSIDYSEIGGAMFLGLNDILVKCHGSSDRKAIYNGIRAAKTFAEVDIHKKLKKSLS